MNTSMFATVYAAVLHIAGLLGMVVLVALGKISWAEAGPIIGGLVGLGVGVPLVVNGTQKPDDTKPQA